MTKPKGKYAAPRKPMGKQRKLLVLTAALLLVLSVTAVLALYLRNTDTLDNTFQKVQVSCTLEETYHNNEKSRIAVNNTSTMDAYIRVRLVSYWKAPSGDVAARDSGDIPEFALADGWIADEANDTYYYRYPVPSGGKTPNLLKAGSTITLKSEEGYTQVIEILAEAIQAQPRKAAEQAWGKEMADQLSEDYPSQS